MYCSWVIQHKDRILIDDDRGTVDLVGLNLNTNLMFDVGTAVGRRFQILCPYVELRLMRNKGMSENTNSLGF